MTAPYWSSDDGGLQLYLGDCRELLPALGIHARRRVCRRPAGRGHRSARAVRRGRSETPTSAAGPASAVHRGVGVNVVRDVNRPAVSGLPPLAYMIEKGE